jgi:hypothetical protein
MKYSAQVVLINEKGLILGVSRKDNHKDMGLPGGKMEDEDMGNIQITAIRETKEETGLDVTNLQMVFATHKYGFMSYTYLANYTGEINHNEPHVVKWVPMQVLINGSFGKYNKLVSESLKDMKIDFQMGIDMDALSAELDVMITKHYNGNIKFSGLRDSWMSNGAYEIYFDDEDGELEETFGFDKSLDRKLEALSDKYGVRISLCSDYYGK